MSKILSRETACSVSDRLAPVIAEKVAELKWARDHAVSCPPLSYHERRALSLARDDLDAILNASAQDVDGAEIPAPLTAKPRQLAEAAE